MKELPGTPAAFWVETSTPTAYPPLDRELTVDVAVLGGGIAGMTTALLLARSDLKVGGCAAGLPRPLCAAWADEGGGGGGAGLGGGGVPGSPPPKAPSLHSLTY